MISMWWWIILMVPWISGIGDQHGDENGERKVHRFSNISFFDTENTLSVAEEIAPPLVET